MLIKGTRYSDNLAGTDFADDQIFGLGGNDVLYGGWGDDLVNGNAGNDQISGDYGNDDLRGGQGNDRLLDWYGGADFFQGGKGNDELHGNAVDYQRDTLHGGQGNDNVAGGTGYDLMIGGQGDDTISGMGGEYYGDAGPGVRPIAGGQDRFLTDLANDYGTPRVFTGGGGGDLFQLTCNPEGVATAVTVTDFTNGEDRFAIFQRTGEGASSNLGDALDNNHDGFLDASDGWSAAGNVSANDASHSLTVTAGDGDSVTFLNTTHLDYIV